MTTADMNRLASHPASHCSFPNGFERTPGDGGWIYDGECAGASGVGHITTVVGSGDMQTFFVAESDMAVSRAQLENFYVIDSTMSGLDEPGPFSVRVRIAAQYEGACHGDE